MEVLSSKITKAIKFHVCDYCGQHIEKGTMYKSESNKSDVGLYSWKSHLHCGKIANKLNMFDDVDEGLTAEGFRENISVEYDTIMRLHNEGIFESKGYKHPKFSEQLKFVLDYHGLINI